MTPPPFDREKAIDQLEDLRLQIVACRAYLQFGPVPKGGLNPLLTQLNEVRTDLGKLIKSTREAGLLEGRQ